MDMRKNNFKAALKEMHLQKGLWCTINDIAVAEMLAGCGFDWLLFDTEHSPIDTLGILPLLQAAAPYPVTPMVRPTHLDAAEIKKLLDLGAQTILVPYVQNAEEAAYAVACITYPPNGIRGVAGMTRGSGFGTIADYHKHANDELCLVVQVETQEALDNIESIAAVPGIDGIFIGPADLAASMGFPGEPNHPTVKEAIIDATRRIRAAGLPPGILTLDQAFVTEVIDAGAVFVANDVDMSLLRRAAVERQSRF